MKIAEKYDLKRLCRDLYLSGVNLAESRHDWIVLMLSLAGGGEDLRESFLNLASQGSTYKKRESQREFSKAINKCTDDSLAWLLHKARDLGYRLDDYLTLEGQRDREEWIARRTARSRNLLPSIHRKPMNSSTNPTAPLQLIPQEYVTRCRSNSSTFIRSLASTGLLTEAQAQQAAELYHLGAMRDGSVIYWQIDAQGRVRDGKVMLYGPDCHRLKDQPVRWMGWLMSHKFRGADQQLLLPASWHATQCLFGEHLLHADTSLICVVEAEKTAVILSQLHPEALWLAAGGESQLTVDKLSALQGRKVILYPDTDPEGKTYALWLRIANEARSQLGLDISVSDILEQYASPAQKAAKIDLVDLLLEPKKEGESVQTEASQQEQEEVPQQELPASDDTLLQELVETFDLVPV